jgi:hypothetical protein
VFQATRALGTVNIYNNATARWETEEIMRDYTFRAATCSKELHVYLHVNTKTDEEISPFVIGLLGAITGEGFNARELGGGMKRPSSTSIMGQATVRMSRFGPGLRRPPRAAVPKVVYGSHGDRVQVHAHSRA